MSKELDDLAREHQKSKPTVIFKDLNLYQTSLNTAASSFLREVEYQAKKEKQANIKLIAMIPEILDRI